MRRSPSIPKNIPVKIAYVKMVRDIILEKGERLMKTLEDYMKLAYRVNIIPDPDEGGYTAYYPDLPGCMTCVESIDELEDMLKDAKKTWIASELKQGRNILEPVYDGEFSG